MSDKGWFLGPDPGGGPLPVMPLGRIHMFGGGSGTGKTRLLYQMIKAAQSGEDFLGYPTQFQPVTYCAFDRRVEEQEETMRAVGLDPATVPHHYIKVPPMPSNGMPDNRALTLINDVLNANPATRVLILDAMFILAAHGQMNNYCIMAEWLQRLGDMCDAMGIAIIGVVHSSKQREGQRITDPRVSITGSVATGGFTSCQIIVETPDSKKEPDKRLIWVYPRNARQQCFEMEFNEQGVLVPDKKSEADKIYTLEHKVFAEAGKPLTLNEIAALMKGQLGASLASTKRYLATLVEQKSVVKVGHGLYTLRGHDEGMLPKVAGEDLPW